MYLRFITSEIDLRTGKPKGIFTAAYQLLDSNMLNKYEEEEARSILKWFSQNLEIPNNFSRKRNSYHKNEKGISWIKESSREEISKLWELKRFMEDFVVVEMVTTSRPGYIVYEDDKQIVAEPFNREIY